MTSCIGGLSPQLAAPAFTVRWLWSRSPPDRGYD